ncbi:3-phosphoserine/phosphohydroxythreonine transaminase [Buchnera aphidicola]|uniref:Phosphoserine aminotransferase n=1 Tax=Buchnera aphidicola subsp. Acyrthosiphon pisum (strain Tuc7) TaxID=561501 RepID=SERC_BUCAT|nr:3-phosphoserine/phosphohydroxythreonine transaminase [Buchnera aphidicola]B8D7K4.1 RecName: Full=Phosphoserine aminotransferase; AltName: Full=Phosphohydroxythreonine aminotransferase; Short=PSAT [Buchnera aphidicola str. Tuc7 (Acyrthosiphon pisum)]ACL30119.1 phosphoserine aminotransferase [Buchnera aphidicola str. Tuc7 (Acyrthosiphon pisum)]ADP66132.1 phosphoserine aminotransferase [Buchnera aphidicola str. LL01 (Acyrthosiphon pisum)]ADP66704.1 phosphoserine aminotransferase [Buchnera aphid
MNLIYNFSAGPAMIPRDVLNQAKKELHNWKNLGSSIMEISHRSEEFIQMALEAEKDLRDLLKIPDSFKVLFCQGGARGQFSAIPMNLLNNLQTADYINSGYWSNSAFMEAKKYCTPRSIFIRETNGVKESLLPMHKWNINENSAYIHYCPNETIDGLSIYEEPVFENKIIVGDFSSFILSRSINIKNYDLIYAGAQKNIGPAGITIIIIRKNIIGSSSKMTPSILDYKKISDHHSMFNTPPTFAWYLSGLVFKWLKKQGGLKAIEKLNKKKSDLLYKKIDNSDFYINKINSKHRSQMNVVFHLVNPKLNYIFLKEASKTGLNYLRGHSIVGGMRASLYNAMPLEGVESLVKFMSYFEKRYG